MKRRIATITMAVCLAVGMFTGCVKNENAGNGKMTIKWASVGAREENSVIERYLEEKYDVNIDIISISSNYYEKLGAMIASGEIPDVMFMNEIENWQPLAKQGVLAEIKMETVEKYAPKLVEEINKSEPKTWKVCQYEDVMYALPKYTGMEYNSVAVWRQDWLDKLGVTKLPETIEEYEEVLYKISHGDPDGNGVNDTYGLTAWGNFAVGLFDKIFGAYGVMPEQWNLQDGKIVNGAVADGAKTVLEVLHRWYEKGIIDPEFITDTVSSEVQKFESGRLGLYFTDAANYVEEHPSGKPHFVAWAQRNPKARFSIGSLPKGPDGKYGNFKWGLRTNFVVFGQQVEEDVEKQAKIMTMLSDMLFDEETAKKVTWGDFGVTYDYNDPEIGEASGFTYIGDYTNADARAEYGIGYDSFFTMLRPLLSWGHESFTDKYNPPEIMQYYNTISQGGGYTDAILRAVLPSATQYEAELDKIRLVEHCAFITGERNLDEWDEFVNEWYSAGGEILTKEAQNYYDNVLNN